MELLELSLNDCVLVNASHRLERRAILCDKFTLLYDIFQFGLRPPSLQFASETLDGLAGQEKK